MSNFTPLMPHGELEEVFPDVFFVTGTTRPNFGGQEWQFSRNMTVVRDGRTLTLINTVRLNDAGLAKLDSLGTVTNVVRIGAFHGIDDPFYMDRYDAHLWALPGMQYDSGLTPDRELTVGGAMPSEGCSLFVYETADQPEAVLLLEREHGILISCDSLQNWREVDQYFNDASAENMRAAGFIEPANIGPGWRQFCNPEAADFERLKALPFRHLLSAHGTPLRDTAHEELSNTFNKVFGV